MKALYCLPLLIFTLIALLFWRGLHLQPSHIPSPFIGKPAPHFTLDSLLNQTKVSDQLFQGQVTLLNVWATWCYACAEEHPFLLKLARDSHVRIIGLNYKDDPHAAKAWLEKEGNPYQTIAIDMSGQTAIDWGVYGTPETFIIDKHGIVRYKQIGPITSEAWEHTLAPLIQKLWSES